MKQIIQNLKSGQTILEEVPAPIPKAGEVLIKTHRSLVSLGTERMLVEFGKANYLQKARQQPERVKQVIQKIKSDGLKPTLEAVFRKLGQPLPLGYCNAGEVIGVGKEITEFRIGDRVVSNGHHAEVVSIPENLVAKIPECVSYDEAAFTVISSIGLQGIRLAKPTFGEIVVVSGLGLIGLITSQLLLANGCRVIGLDIENNKIDLARSWGVEAFNIQESNGVKLVHSLTNDIGADAVLITASNTSNQIIADAANMCRKRGRIILVGVVGSELNRSDFYEKELSFQVSCSYGPGRYDSNYEEKGMDFPIEYVRWTEKRNFEAVLQAIKQKQLNLNPLISEVVPLDDFNEIYGNMSKKNIIASLIQYSVDDHSISNEIVLNPKTFEPSKAIIGIIGAGNFSSSVIVPSLAKLKVPLKSIVSARGLTGSILAKKYGIERSTTDYEKMLKDDEIKAVVISTQHNLHAEQVIKSLDAGKHVFVEKPLALNLEELEEIRNAYERSNKSLMVGFNRRFSPFSIKAKSVLGNHNLPINVIATMNAGFISLDHWTQDLEIGGGRIIGEACHYIDLISFFTGSEVKSVTAQAQGIDTKLNSDIVSIILKYKNGSLGVINYYSNGHKSYQKERIEIFAQGRNIIIDNFRVMKAFGFSSGNMSKSQDKGHFEQFNRWIKFLNSGGDPLISFHSLQNTSKTAIACLESIKNNSWVEII